MSVLSYLRERAGERSSQVQLVALVLTAAVATGLVSMDQIQAWAGKFGNVILLLGPIAGFLVPEAQRSPSPEEVTAAAEDLLTNDPRYAVVRGTVEAATDAFEGLRR